jgi:hypothetical protein
MPDMRAAQLRTAPVTGPIYLDECPMTLDDVAMLKDDYDHDGTPAPSKASINFARALVDSGLKPVTVVPSVEGGVSLYLEVRPRYRYVTINAAGDALYVVGPERKP